MNDTNNSEKPNINISEDELKKAVSEKEIEAEKEAKDKIKTTIEKILKKD